MQTCDRCNKPTHYSTGSYFNLQMICSSCEDKERKHPQFQHALDTETKEVLKGNLNYKGVGLPKDLK